MKAEALMTVCNIGPEHRDRMFLHLREKLTFVRYNDTYKKGVFQDTKGERVFLDGDTIVVRLDEGKSR